MLTCIFLLVFVSGTNAFQSKGGKLNLDNNDRATLHNQYGTVVQDSTGKRINYSREELELQAAQASAKTPPVQSPVAKTEAFPNVEANWGYATFGSGIGISNIVVAQNGNHTEIYSGGGDDSYWIALRYNPTTNDYDQIYVSPYIAFSISRIKVADVIGNSDKEIVVTLENGTIYLYNQATKSLITTITTAATGLTGMEITDVDGDNVNDIILCSTFHIYVYSGGGVLKWDLANVGGYELVVGQMDTDNAQEIAVTDGSVIDCDTHTVQWKRPQEFGRHLAAADIDNDGMKELIVAEGWQFVWAYDVDRKLPKWSISTSQDIGAILVTDIDNNGSLELLVGQGQWGAVIAFDPMTQQQKWAVENPEHGVTNIAVGNADGDGAMELLWGAGATSSGQDHLYVANWQTQQIEWQNTHLDGPFIGPEVGDLDGDGRNEMVAISSDSNSGYSSGRILVFDAITQKLRAISGPTMSGLGWTGIHDLKLRDVNRDGRLEILVAASFTYDGVIEIYSFDSSNNFTLNWTNTTQPFGAPFYSVDAADVDGDGEMEIVGGVGAAHSGVESISIYVYSYNTSNEKWRSLHMGQGGITALSLADIDGDGSIEMIGMTNEHDVYIFDGASKVLEDILVGPFTAMRVQNVGGQPTIVLGNGNGELIMYRYSAGAYNQTYRQTLINKPIDGFTIDPQERVWIGSIDDSFSHNSGLLNQVTLGGTVLATYTGYGPTFGLRTAFVPRSGKFFTTGSYSILGFPSSNSIATTIGTYSPSDRTFYLRNTNNVGNADFTVQYGPAGAIPVVGDWDGNGTITIGVYDPSSRTFYLRNSNTPGNADLVIQYGPSGAIPVVGDWDGNGTTTIGVYDPSSRTFYLRNNNNVGFADFIVQYGPAGAVPVVGDWDGNGTTTIGVYDPGSRTFYLRNSNSIGFADFTIQYGPTGVTPVVGDFDGNGTTTIGVYETSTRTFYLRNSNTIGNADITVSYGPSGATPLSGNWDGL
jgi:hypothetical protein